MGRLFPGFSFEKSTRITSISGHRYPKKWSQLILRRIEENSILLDHVIFVTENESVISDYRPHII